MGYVFPLAEVRAFLDALRAADIRADLDPAQCAPPAVWLRLLPFEHDTLGGVTVRAEATCIAPDTTDDAALGHLAALHDLVVDLVDADGPCRWQGTILPDNPTPLPSLVIPVLIETN